MDTQLEDLKRQRAEIDRKIDELENGVLLKTFILPYKKEDIFYLHPNTISVTIKPDENFIVSIGGSDTVLPENASLMITKNKEEYSFRAVKNKEE